MIDLYTGADQGIFTAYKQVITPSSSEWYMGMKIGSCNTQV